ncbi:nucleoside hydrolase [Phycicoccus endophyticus]|uniref:Nucleoside hydrolase n=1 Tax=Phycicoccus endophyticus TaxID=1690220 RepID=A0A7G9R1I5_9MICO|nr:nucleoside hydrolase [Phycicoccus endophyticus]NHI18753.1 nucleoside hydrolase [Phycicoccus endophyticus]QNN49460.1 nucleoside hydrolase [Phycicoccus endophyticus]GGL36777.1 hypothetical protein GCM10012283_19080 [Phycicoccus endophyticus]
MTGRTIVLDTDLALGAPGSDVDDGFALALALADPTLDLRLVTTVAGNTDVTSATTLSLRLLEMVGRPDIPVVRGAAGPLLDPARVRPADPAVLEHFGRGTPAPGYAPAAIADLVLARPGEVTVVAIGPLTNVATALVLDPRVAGAVREIVVMGGYFLGQMGDAGTSGEFNIWSDPDAAHVVLHSGAPLRFVGLDVTYRVHLDEARCRELAARDTAFARLAGEAALAWVEALRTRHPGSAVRGLVHLHDPLAVAAVTHPELLTWHDAAVEVVRDGVGRGITVADLRRREDPPPANARIALEVDTDAFLALLLAAL